MSEAPTIESRRVNGSLIGTYPGANILEAAQSAVQSGADLRGAYLYGDDEPKRLGG